MKRLLVVLLCAIGMVLGTVPMHAQDNIRLEGRVLDGSTGEPVIGASVLVKDTTTGTVTDLDGHFTFSVPAGSVLVVSSIGYESYEWQATKDDSALTITLKTSAEFLDDVVVVAYGSVRKANLSGAVDQVSEETFRGRPTANATQMLLGAIPNLNINIENGKPGQSADYNVRGTTSIGSGGSALVLIDGVEGDPAMLNPNDIESVSVLKDAASAAVYGSRATFGVVLITTKNPESSKEKFTLTYSGNLSVLQPTNIPDIIEDGYVYSRLFYEAYTNYNKTSPTGINKSQPFSVSWMDDFRLRKLDRNPRTTTLESDGSYVYYGNTNYYDVLYKDNVLAHSHNLSASGTEGRLSYYLSGRIYDYSGLFNYNPDVYQTFNIRGKASMKLFPWLTVTENMSYDYDSYHIPSSWSSEGKGNFWRSINDEGHPSSALFNPDGSMTASTAYAIGGLITGNNYEDRVVKTFKSTTGIKAFFFNNTFRINGDFSFLERDKNESTKRSAVPYSTRFGETLYLGNPYADDTFQEYDSIQHYLATNLYAEYENTFAGKHWFKALGGWNYEERTNKGVTVKRNGLLTPDVNAMNLAIGDTMSSSSSGTKWRVAGLFFRLNYGYHDRYLLEINGRYDGSSKFPVNSQWGFFPSASAAWRVSKEQWWHIAPEIVSNLKLRASFGELGNGNVSPYAYMERFSFSNSGRLLDGERERRYTGIPSQIPDNLTWETARTLDFGADMGFLRGRLEITADIYRRWTLNMYTQGPTLPDTYGASTPKGNYADLHTDGYELTVDWHDSFKLAGKPFDYNLKATLADSRAWIDRYNNPTGTIHNREYYEGMEVGDLWGFVVNGLFQTQDEIDNCYGPGIPYVNTAVRTSVDYSTQPGDIKVEDLNGNHRIDFGSETLDDPGDKTIIGNTRPRYLYSFNLGFDWNGFFFSAFLQGVGHQDWIPSGECSLWGPFNRPYDQMPKWIIGNYWTEDNRDAWLPVLTGYYRPFYSGYETTRYMLNAAYLRLKNLQFGWHLPTKWAKAISMSDITVYLSGENLYTWSPVYKWTRDLDIVTAPNGSDSDISSDSVGDGHNYPSMRTFSFGLTLKF